MTTDGPPDFSSAKLDFSEFHPLDHWPFTAYCRSRPGGTRRHLKYTWEFRRRDQLLAPWHWLRCRTGRHQFVEGWHRADVDSPWERHVECAWCCMPCPNAHT
jgi:hypothetical protein